MVLRRTGETARSDRLTGHPWTAPGFRVIIVEMFDRLFAVPRPLHVDDPVQTCGPVVDRLEPVGVVAHLFTDTWLMHTLAPEDEPAPVTVYFAQLLDHDPTLDEIRELDRGGLAVRRPGEPWRHTRFWSDNDFRQMMRTMRGVGE